MVWFQCESCGENLKKPKLVNHFRGCAARKLSCIDCGVVFDQQSVQVHTSCVSETEKYGPKDGSNGAAQKPKSSQAHKAGDVDLSIGLSTSSPWNCSLCNVNTTSYETLESHSQGKKHRAKAKAAHAKLNSVPVVEAALDSHGNGSQPKASAETKGLEPVEDGKLLPTSKGKEVVEDGKLLPTSEGKEVVEDGKLLPTSEGKEVVEDGKLLPTFNADDVDLSIGLSKKEAGYPYTCSLCKVTAKGYDILESHSQGKKHRTKAMAVHAMLKSKADDVDLSIGISTEEAGYPYTCSLCKVTTTSYESIVRHAQAKKHRANAMAAHANSHGNGSQPNASAETEGSEPVEDAILLPTFKAGFPWTCSLCEKPIWETKEKHEQGLKHCAKVEVLKSIEKHSQRLKQAALAELNPVTVVEAASNSHVSKGKRKREKGKAARAKLAKVEAASNSPGNGSQSKASAETKGSEPVEDGKLLATSKGKEGYSKKRKAGDEREKKSGGKRKKSKQGEKPLDAAAEGGIVSSENGGGNKLQVKNSVTRLAFGKLAKWRKLTTKVLLNVKAPEKGIKLKDLLNEILPSAIPGADNLDKKGLEKRLARTLNVSSKFEVRGDWVALATTS